MKNELQQNAVNGRRNFLKATAGTLVGATAMTGLAMAENNLSGARAMGAFGQEIGRAIPADPFQSYFDNLYFELSRTSTANRLISSQEANELAANMVEEASSPEEFKTTLQQFYALNAPSVELVTTRMRILMDTSRKIDGQEPVNEAVARMNVSQLNRIAQGETGVPFHLAALKGEQRSFDAYFDNAANARTSATASTTGNCQEGIYPRYVSYMAPWKLQTSFHVEIRSRREDSGCNFNHGPFKHLILGWSTLTPAVWGVVGLNMWGGKLACNDNNFFLKNWTLAPLGLNPYSLMLKLYARRP